MNRQLIDLLASMERQGAKTTIERPIASGKC